MKSSFLIFLFSLLVSFSFGQAIQKGTGITYTNGVPTHVPRTSTESEYVIDISSGKGDLYLWNRPTNAWKLIGEGIDVVNNAAVPTIAPAYGESRFRINNVPRLYFWNGSAWILISGSSVYVAGTGIDVTGLTISNTGDLSNTNEIQQIDTFDYNIGTGLLRLSLSLDSVPYKSVTITGGSGTDTSGYNFSGRLSGDTLYILDGNGEIFVDLGIFRDTLTATNWYTTNGTTTSNLRIAQIMRSAWWRANGTGADSVGFIRHQFGIASGSRTNLNKDSAALYFVGTNNNLSYFSAKRDSTIMVFSPFDIGEGKNLNHSIIGRNTGFILRTDETNPKSISVFTDTLNLMGSSDPTLFRANLLSDNTYFFADSTKTVAIGQFPDFPDLNSDGREKGFYYSPEYWGNVSVHNGDGISGSYSLLELEPSNAHLTTDDTNSQSRLSLNSSTNENSLSNSPSSALLALGTIQFNQKFNDTLSYTTIGHAVNSTQQSAYIVMGIGGRNGAFLDKSNKRKFAIQTHKSTTQAYNWLEVEIPTTATDTTSDRIKFYNGDYAWDNATPSLTVGDTSFHVWVGNGVNTTPQFLELNSLKTLVASNREDSTWVKINGSYLNKRITDAVYRTGKTGIMTSDTSGYVNIKDRANTNFPAVSVKSRDVGGNSQSGAILWHDAKEMDDQHRNFGLWYRHNKIGNGNYPTDTVPLISYELGWNFGGSSNNLETNLPLGLYSFYDQWETYFHNGVLLGGTRLNRSSVSLPGFERHWTFIDSVGNQNRPLNIFSTKNGQYAEVGTSANYFYFKGKDFSQKTLVSVNRNSEVMPAIFNIYNDSLRTVNLSSIENVSVLHLASANLYDTSTTTIGKGVALSFGGNGAFNAKSTIIGEYTTTNFGGAFDLIFTTGNDAQTAQTKKVWIKSGTTPLIGINQSSPAQTLDVTGTLLVRGGTRINMVGDSAALTLKYASTQTNPILKFQSNSGTDVLTGHVFNTTSNPTLYFGLSPSVDATSGNNTVFGLTTPIFSAGAGNNSFFGRNVGDVCNGCYENTLSGALTGDVLTNGYQNSGYGYNVFGSLTTGTQNTASGRNALSSLTTTSGNSVYGIHAFRLNVGSFNTGMGGFVGDSVLGSNNTLIGYSAGRLAGSGNVFLGYAAGEVETGSNLLIIDNSNNTTPLIKGNFTTDTLRIFGTFEVGKENLSDTTAKITLTGISGSKKLFTSGSLPEGLITGTPGDFDYSSISSTGRWWGKQTGTGTTGWVEFWHSGNAYPPTSLGTSNQMYGVNNAGTAGEWKTLLGTTNQVTITDGVGTKTWSLPQDIHTAATPTFSDLTLTDDLFVTDDVTIGTSTINNLTVNGSALSALNLNNTGLATIGTTSGGIILNNGAVGGFSQWTVGSSGEELNRTAANTSGTTSTTDGVRTDYIMNDGSALDGGHFISVDRYQSRGVASTIRSGAQMIVKAPYTWTDASAPAQFLFSTTPVNSTTLVDRMLLNHSGEVHFLGSNGTRYYDTDNSNFVHIRAPQNDSLTANYTLVLPRDNGSDGQVLKIRGDSLLYWGNDIGTDTHLGNTNLTANANTRTYTIEESLRFLGTNDVGGQYGFQVNIGGNEPRIQLWKGSSDSTWLNQSDVEYVFGSSAILSVYSDDYLILQADSITMSTLAAVTKSRSIVALASNNTANRFDGNAAGAGEILMSNATDWVVTNPIATLTPAELTSTTNNWNPTGYSTYIHQNITFSGNSSFQTVTGLTAATRNGVTKTFYNNGTNCVVFAKQHTSSSAGNRFDVTKDVVFYPQMGATFRYDSINADWELLYTNKSEVTYGNTIEYNQRDWGGVSGDDWFIDFTAFGGTYNKTTASSTDANIRRNSLNTGAVATSYPTLTSYTGQIYLTLNKTYIRQYARVRLEDLSTAAEDFDFRYGFQTIAAIDSTIREGAYINYEREENSGGWTIKTNDGATTTTTNAGSAIAADTWYDIELIYYPYGEVTAFIDGVRYTTTSTIPEAIGILINLQMDKDNGTTTRAGYYSAMEVQYTYVSD